MDSGDQACKDLAGLMVIKIVDACILSIVDVTVGCHTRGKNEWQEQNQDVTVGCHTRARVGGKSKIKIKTRTMSTWNGIPLTCLYDTELKKERGKRPGRGHLNLKTINTKKGPAHLV